MVYSSTCYTKAFLICTPIPSSTSVNDKKFTDNTGLIPNQIKIKFCSNSYLESSTANLMNVPTYEKPECKGLLSHKITWYKNTNTLTQIPGTICTHSREISF